MAGHLGADRITDHFKNEASATFSCVGDAKLIGHVNHSVDKSANAHSTLSIGLADVSLCLLHTH